MAKKKEKEQVQLSRPLPRKLAADTKKIMFYTLPSYAHVYPFLEIARALVEHGYYVRYYCVEEFRKMIEATGAEFVELDAYLPYQYADLMERIERDFGTLVEMNCDMTVKMEEFIKQEMDMYDPDLIMSEHMCFWGKLFASRFKKPFIDIVPGLANNPHTESLKKIDWGHIMLLEFEMPRINNKMLMLQSFRYQVRGYSSMSQNNDYTKAIVCTTRSIQPKVDTFKKDMVAFIGPCISQNRLRKRKNARKRILISMNLPDTRRDAFYRSVIKAFGNQDLEVILAVPASFDIKKYGSTPDNFRLRVNPDPVDILPDCDLFLCRGAVAELNQSMTFGVPMLVYAATPDEKLVAYQLNALGVGKRTKKLSADRLSQAVNEMLENPSYREKAQVYSAEIRQTNGLESMLNFVDDTLAKKSGYMMVL